MIRVALLGLFVAVAGCSSAPLPPRVVATPGASAPSATPSPIAGATSDVAPADEATVAVEDAKDVGDLLTGGARLALGDGAELVVVVKAPSDRDGAPEVTMALVRGGKVIARRDGFDVVTGVEPTLLTATQPCESWRASLRKEAFGSVDGVRVSIACATGEDYFTSTELAVLFRIDGSLRDLDGLTRIWSGIAAREENAMDSCLTSREVGFRVLDAKTLEKTITETTRWVEQVIGDDVKRALRKDCKLGKSKRMERIALP
jgi:hypothetical protein